MTLSTVAATGASEVVVSSWKLESSSTKRSGQRPSSGSASSTATPMLPATIVDSPADRHSALVSAVTVVLPFEPVIADDLLPGRKRAREKLDVADDLGAARDRLRDGRRSRRARPD